jgi:hypothetical protein
MSFLPTPIISIDNLIVLRQLKGVYPTISCDIKSLLEGDKAVLLNYNKITVEFQGCISKTLGEDRFLRSKNHVLR